jgi:chaperonin GroES
MKLKPMSDNVLIQRTAAQEVTPGGIIIPDAAQKKTTTAVVVAVGPGKVSKDGVLLPMTVKPGDTVLLSEWSGQEIELGGEKHIFVGEGEILAIFETSSPSNQPYRQSPSGE